MNPELVEEISKALLNKQVVKSAITSYGKGTVRLMSVFFKTLLLERNVDFDF